MMQVNEELCQLKSALKDIKSGEMEKSSELGNLQTRLESTKLELRNQQSVMEQQISALKFQLSSQQMQADIAMQV